MTERFAFLTSVKTGVAAVAGTLLSSFGMMLDWMPAKAPAFVAMLLSFVLIYVNIRRGRIEAERAEREKALFDLEVEQMASEERRRERQFNERWRFYKTAGDRIDGETALPPGAKPPKK